MVSDIAHSAIMNLLLFLKNLVSFSGTLCNTVKDCGADMNCINLGNLLSEDKFCTPKLNEGATCGGLVDASGSDDKINPCARGLKCALVG